MIKFRNQSNIFSEKRLTTNMRPNLVRGFTIVEMMTVIAIMTLISAAMIVNNGRFGDDLLLTNLAYDIASTIREAQSYGLSTKDWKENLTQDLTTSQGLSTYSQQFNAGYGIRFASVDSGTTPGNKKFVLFNEINDNTTGLNNWHCGVSGAGGDSNPDALDLAGCHSSKEFMKDYSISGRNSISEICATSPSGSDCYDFTTGTGQKIGYLDIIFRRGGPGGSPQPDAYISTCNSPDTGDSNCNIYPKGNYQSAEITLTSRSGLTKKVVISQLGQITVK